MSLNLSALLPPGDLWGRVGVGYTRGLGRHGGVIRSPPEPAPGPHAPSSLSAAQTPPAGGGGRRDQSLPFRPVLCVERSGIGVYFKGRDTVKSPGGPPTWSLSRGQICLSPLKPGMDGWGWDSRELGFLCVCACAHICVCVSLCVCMCVCVSVCVHARVTAPSSVSLSLCLTPRLSGRLRTPSPAPLRPGRLTWMLQVLTQGRLAVRATGPGPAPGFFSLQAAARPDPWRQALLASPEQAALS